MKILVTGCCGFIGYNVCLRLLEDGNYVIGIDNFDNYYDVNVKRLKCDSLKSYENFVFSEDDIITTDIIERLKPEKICHLASKAGVRNSILDPKSYVRNNIEGFFDRNIYYKFVDLALENNYIENKLLYVPSNNHNHIIGNIA